MIPAISAGTPPRWHKRPAAIFVALIFTGAVAPAMGEDTITVNATSSASRRMPGALRRPWRQNAAPQGPKQTLLSKKPPSQFPLSRMKK